MFLFFQIGEMKYDVIVGELVSQLIGVLVGIQWSFLVEFLGYKRGMLKEIGGMFWIVGIIIFKLYGFLDVCIFVMGIFCKR